MPAVAEQVINVPKISHDRTQQRLIDSLRQPQMRRTVGGSAHDRILFFVARGCGAERRHSSSSWAQVVEVVVFEVFSLCLLSRHIPVPRRGRSGRFSRTESSSVC